METHIDKDEYCTEEGVEEKYEKADENVDGDA